MSTGAESSSKPARRDHWRTLRTITCELRALTGPAQRPGFGRPLATPEMIVELPRFQGHALRGPLLLPRPVERSIERPRVVTQAEPRYLAWVGPLMLFAITGLLLGSIIALASG